MHFGLRIKVAKLLFGWQEFHKLLVKKYLIHSLPLLRFRGWIFPAS
jgi:hypothetical protein